MDATTPWRALGTQAKRLTHALSKYFAGGLRWANDCDQPRQWPSQMGCAYRQPPRYQRLRAFGGFGGQAESRCQFCLCAGLPSAGGLC